MDHMEQTEFGSRSNELDLNPQLSAVEIFVLSFLQNNPEVAEPHIDMISLQMECSQQGYPPRVHSYGFVCLLTRGLLVPHGEFRYALSAKGRSMEIAATYQAIESWDDAIIKPLAERRAVQG